MNLLELYASVSLDSSGYESGVNKVVGGSGRISAAAVAFGNVISEVIKGAVTALGKLARTSITTGAQWETSFAKVKTIMNPEDMGFDDMEDAIIDLSKETGIAADSIAESVYNIISATGDTSGAVDIARQATMLATAGFTDADSAVSVLTTAMNAYHMSAEDVVGISDSLIMVQNLGVTTVAELSTQMGKAIATGSAYGVSMSNLEAGYIALTKNGIDTAQATTYLSSMMNELGKSGSDASKILQRKTGMSFGECMASGMSLADVLKILYDSCDGNTEAFKNMFGSAEAGNAAMAICTQGFENFNGWIEQVGDSAGATASAYAIMAETFQTKTSKLKTTIQSKLIQVFERIAPILGDMVEGATAFFDSLDVYAIGEGLAGALAKVQGWISAIDWAGAARRITTAIKTVMGWISTLYGYVRAYIGNLLANIDFTAMFAALSNAVSTVVEWIYDNWETILPVLETVGGAILGIITALKVMKGVSAISGVAKAVSKFMATLAANPVLIIVAAIGALVGALVVLYKKCEPFRNFVNNLFGRIKAFALPIIADLKTTFMNTWESIKGIFAGMGEGSGELASAFSLIGEACAEIWNVAKPILTALLNFFVNRFVNKIKLGLEVVGSIAKAVTAAFRGDWDGVKTALSGVIDALKNYIIRGWDNIITTFGTIWNTLRGYVSSGWESTKGKLAEGINGVMNALTGGKWETIKGKFSGVFQTLRGYVSSGWAVAKENLGLVLEGIQALFSGDWETAKAKFSTVFNNLRGYVSIGWEVTKTLLTNAISTIKGLFTAEGWETTKAKFSGVWQSLRGYASSGWEYAKGVVATVVEDLKAMFGEDNWNAAVTAMQSVVLKMSTNFVTGFNGLKTLVTTKLNAVKTAISTVVNKIKSWFDWSSWTVKLPHIPTLHVNWNSQNLGIFGNVQVPSFSFYAKAMNVPMLLNGATIFGAMGGKMLAGGETGQEVISGTATLMGMISDAVANTVSGRMNDIYNLLAAELPGIADINVVLDDGAIVGKLAGKFDRALGQISTSKRRGAL